MVPTAVPVAVSSLRCCSLYHCDTTMGVQPGLPTSQHGTELWQAPPRQWRATSLTAPAARCWLEQVGIQTQPSDQTDVAVDRGKQFERRETAVGDEHQPTMRHPTSGLQNGLPSPVGERLVPLALRFAPSC